MAISLDQILIIYVWFALAVLLTFLLLIARFYQRLARQNTFYPAFVLTIVLFGLASARNAYVNQLGDGLAELLWAAGGLLLVVLCVHLYTLMTARR